METFALSPDLVETDSNLDSAQFGQKARGLAGIPKAWRLPFGIISTKSYSTWEGSGDSEKSSLVRSVSQEIFPHCANWSAKWPHGIILRTSAAGEYLGDRGALKSHLLPGEYDMTGLSRVISEMYAEFAKNNDLGLLAIIFQPLVPSAFLGHLSNERRVSKTINHWQWEFDPPTIGDGRFNSQRAKPPNEFEGLDARDQRSFPLRLQSIGRWCTELGRGPVHMEWAWAADRLWILQIDFENESSDNGVDPKSIIPALDNSPTSTLLPVESPISQRQHCGPKTGWRKIDNISEFIPLLNSPYPTLYHIDGATLLASKDSGYDVASDIAGVTNDHAVVRTECINPKRDGINLPKTDCVNANEAVAFMLSTLRNNAIQEVNADKICFIFHRFIPAAASAWVLAEPDEQLVIVDALWGVPDGLQYLPHDSFEFDIRRDQISSETLRYKPAFIQECQDGKWMERKISRNVARHRSVPSRTVREIATLTKQIATTRGTPVQVMWFCGIPEKLGIGKNIPWFVMPGVSGRILQTSTRDEIEVPRRRIEIHNMEDVRWAKLEADYRSILVLEPAMELIRKENDYLRPVIDVALEKAIPVELRGSRLSHAYYRLNRAGITTIVCDDSHRSRARGRRSFHKLVRDGIPNVIEQGGERATLAKIAKSEERAALLAKLLEEAHELLKAETPDEVRVELADLVEIVKSLCSATGVPWDDVVSTADEKRSRRGSFEQGVVLLETSWPTRTMGGERTPGIILLENLGRTLRKNNGVEISYVSLFSRHEKREIDIVDGVRIRWSLEPLGIRLEIVNKGECDSTQFNLFPG